MPNPVNISKNLAKFLANSKVPNRQYHATLGDFDTFEKTNDLGFHFGSSHVANRRMNDLLSNLALQQGIKKKEAIAGNIMPVHLSITNPLKVEDAGDWTLQQFGPQLVDLKILQPWELEKIASTAEKLTKNEKDYAKKVLKERQYTMGQMKRAIENAGYDGIQYSNKFETSKKLSPNSPNKDSWVAFYPEQIKSAIGNEGAFDPFEASITKKEGGKINPIKSPREMLFEMAGIPSLAGGGKAKIGAEMYRLVTDAIERYTKKFGRPPPPEDVKALRQHVEEISKKPEISTDPATQARARHEMATDPNLINPEGPDPFLTKATTGRTVRSTYLKPKVQDIADPNVQANIEAKQAAGELEDILPESITPSADYMGRMGTAVENATLASGKTPLIDKLKANFFAKHKRYPTDEELEVIIAEFNPARHQYGTMGPSVVTQRPPTAKGMSEWRARARMEGVPEAYLDKPPADYPKYLRDELELMRGVQPGTTPLPATRINPDRPFASGGSVMATSPMDMQAEMAVKGKGFKPFAKKIGKRALQGLNIAAVPLGAYETAESSKELGRRLAKKDYLGAANKALTATGAAISTIPFVGWLPGLGLYAAGEGLDYLSQNDQPEYSPDTASVTKMLKSKSDPLARQPSLVDWYLADKWVTNSGLE